MKKVLALVLALLMLFSLAACAGGNKNTGQSNTGGNNEGKKPETLKIRLAHDYQPGSANYDGMEEYKKRVEERSNGTIIIDLYSKGELSGSNSQTTFKLLQSGDIDMAIVPPPNTDAWQLYYLPFFFRNQDVALDASEGKGGQMMLSLLRGSNNVEGLCFLPIAMRAMTNSKRPIETPADMKGLNFRVLDVPAMVAFMKAFGASAVPTSMAELYMSLQNGTVDGQENPLDTILSRALYEVQDYLSITDHLWSFSVFAANGKFWDSLTDEQRTLLKECATEISRYVKDLAPKVDEAAYDKLVNEYGMKVNKLTDEQWLEFQKIAKSVWKEMEPTIGSDILSAYMADLGLTWD